MKNMKNIKYRINEMIGIIDTLTSITDAEFAAMPEGEQEANIRAAERMQKRVDQFLATYYPF